MIQTTPYSFDAYQISKDRHGRATVNAKIMKAGMLKYQSPDGRTYYGNISLDELRKAASTASIKPITIKHPKDMLDGSTVGKYQEGTSGSSFDIQEIDGEQWLVGPVVLASDRAVKTAESGKLGVSAGYYRTANKTDKPDVFDFTDIDINHIAIGCDNPRAEGAGISLDEAETGFEYSVKTAQPTLKVQIMKEKLAAVSVGAFSLDEAPIEYADESTPAIEVMKGREKQLVAQIGTTQASLDEFKGELKALKSQNEELEGKVEGMISMDEFKPKLQEFREVERVLETLKIKDEFKTPEDGRRIAVVKAYPDQSFDDVSDEEIKGAFRAIRVKDATEVIKSKEALKTASMDSIPGKKKIKLSQVDVNSLKPKR